MNTRNRSKRASAPLSTSERLLTKKEMEQQPLKYKTCPQVIKKRFAGEHFKREIYEKAGGNAQAIYFTRPSTLDGNYNPNSSALYLSQCFLVLECIGEGSFGVVYKARNRHDGRLYAIKLMKRWAFVQGNYDEIRRVEKIGEHENLVKYYRSWIEKGVVHMQLELCALSLAEYTKTNHSLSIAQLWDILIDVLHALKHLHDLALVHLDIKPDNIMMSEDGKYKLGDFGLLVDLNEKLPTMQSAQTSEGDAKYLAKEVLDGTYSTAADIFSLGISMLELATDIVLPGNGPLWHLLRDGTYLKEYSQLIPSRLRNVILKMMLLNYKERPLVREIFDFPTVRKIVEEREIKPRPNYYAIWRAANNENRTPPVRICLNPNAAMPRNIEPEEDPALNTPVCVTPPRCVSQVMLYTI